MSLMGMKQGIQKFSVPVIALIGISMLASSVYNGLGRNTGSAMRRQETQAEVTVAKVGSLDVTKRMLDRAVDQQLQQFKMFGMPPPPAEALDSYRLQALEVIKSQQALIAAAQKAGVTISDEELSKGIDDVWDKQLRGKLAQQLSLGANATDKDISDALAKQGTGVTIARLKEQFILPDAVKLKLYSDKLTTLEASKVKLDTYKVRHILVKWDGKTTTEAAAKTKAEKLLADVKATPTKFAELAKANSDDPGSKDNGGLYEWKKEELSGLVPEFKAAVEALKPGQTTPTLVRHADPKSYNGFHIIHLDEIGKASQKKLEEAAGGEVNKLVTAATPGIKIEVVDPGMRAMQLFQDGSKDPKKTDEKLRKQTLAELEKIKKDDDAGGTLPLRKAAILEKLKQPDKALAALKDAIQSNGDKVETRIRIATLLLGKGDKTTAVEELAAAEKLALPEPNIWFQLSKLYNQAGNKEGEVRCLQKNQEMTRRQQQLAAQERAAAAQKSDALKLPTTPGKK